MLPKVSIIMATFNRAYLIEETLRSIHNQTYSDWECIIIDDGSKDNTSQVVQKFIAKDTRFIYLQRSGEYKKGLPGCRNQGLDLAKGEFVVFFDDDDISHPQLLELAVSELDNFHNDFCRYLRDTFRGRFVVDFEFINTYSTPKVTKKNIEAVVKNEIPFNSCQILWRKSSIGKERFEESLMYAEEWEFYTRILSRGLEGCSIDKILYFGRKHPNSNTAEFYRKDQLRFDSKIKATELVIKNLALNNLLSPELKKYFIRLGFHLNSRKVIEQTLKNTRSGAIEKLKYRLGFVFYPILRPLFILKGWVIPN